MNNPPTDTPPAPQRRLAWQACLNTRELGGYPVAGGGRTRWGALVRSDSSAMLTLDGQQAARDYGIRTVIDLRTPIELEMAPSPFAMPGAGMGGKYPVYLNIPLDTNQHLAWPSAAPPADLMSDLYVRILETNRSSMAAVLAAVARAGEGGVLFHCQAGKDRSGIVAALILSAVGVPHAVVTDDYAYSFALLVERRTHELSDPHLTPDRLSYLTTLNTALPDTMHHTLGYFDKHYGSIEGYLRTTPLSAADLDLLRQRLVE